MVRVGRFNSIQVAVRQIWSIFWDQRDVCHCVNLPFTDAGSVEVHKIPKYIVKLLLWSSYRRFFYDYFLENGINHGSMIISDTGVEKACRSCNFQKLQEGICGVESGIGALSMSWVELQIIIAVVVRECDNADIEYRRRSMSGIESSKPSKRELLKAVLESS